MSIKYNKQQLEEMISILDQNKTIYSLVAQYLNYNSTFINKKMIDIFKKNINFFMSNEEAFRLLLSDWFKELLPNKEKLINDLVYNNIVKLKPQKYMDNPYFKNVKVNGVKHNNWKFQTINYSPYECFVYNNSRVDGNYNCLPSIGYFDKSFSYLAILENDREWMAIKPNEIETMKKPIENAYGNVLTFGLGLGYFPYMVSLKENINTVTIVEKDENVITLFKEYILPFFSNSEKIKIIKADALDFCKNIIDYQYDYIFVDIWHDVSDGLDYYLSFKSLEQGFKNIKFDYWIEDEIIIYLRTIIVNLLKEIDAGIDPLSVKSKNTQLDSLYSKIYNFLQNKEIDNLFSYLTMENLQEIASYIYNKKED